MNTDTPRTDAETRHCWIHKDGRYVPCGTMVDYRLARELERELESQSKQVDAVARWIEHNHPDGLIDSEPLCHQLDEIRERDFAMIDSLKREIVEAREQIDANLKATLVIERMLYETREQRDRLEEALRVIDQRVMESKDAETDLKFCSEVAFSALAAVKGGNNE